MDHRQYYKTIMEAYEKDDVDTIQKYRKCYSKDLEFRYEDVECSTYDSRIIEFLISNDIPVIGELSELIKTAYVKGRQDVISFFTEHKAEVKFHANKAIKVAFTAGYHNIICIINDLCKNDKFTDQIIIFCILEGKLVLFGYLYARSIVYASYHLITLAIITGQLMMVKFLKEKGKPMDDKQKEYIRKVGSIDIYDQKTSPEFVNELCS